MPVYSSDLLPAATGGRILSSGGSLVAPDAATVLDWTTQTRVKSYSGTAVLSLWVAAVPALPTASVSLKAQVYTRSAAVSGVAAPVPLTISPFTCGGFQQVWAQLPLGTVKVTGQTVLGVRVWNDGPTAVRLGYDTAEMPAALVVNEK